ncbi:hypothetical protein B0F90DRAFT_1713244 [Multifurca ochricompacta]|uniref:Uncharacterized protein n=1 Tax=Multifurca ochricompacta TaxID=376703 RepID=A0AAD4QPI6_9AGAM|nr:hypothetical protein B0F90DRAFT_1713244 [Multifurca ochricompacta]
MSAPWRVKFLNPALFNACMRPRLLVKKVLRIAVYGLLQAHGAYSQACPYALLQPIRPTCALSAHPVIFHIRR